MQKINYIVQLNNTLNRFNDDGRIKKGHIVLYIALFQKWNRAYFRKTFSINRKEIMDIAKMKSRTSYHNHLKELQKWGYLQHHPSLSKHSGSIIEMTVYRPIIGTGPGTVAVQKMDSYHGSPVQKMVPFIKQINKNINKQYRPKNESEVLRFFKENRWPEIEGKKFFAYLKSQNWKNENWSNVKDWKGLALVYFENDFQGIKTNPTCPISGQVDRARN